MGKITYEDISSYLLVLLTSPLTVVYNFGLVCRLVLINKEMAKNGVVFAADLSKGFRLKGESLQTLFVVGLSALLTGTGEKENLKDYDFLYFILTTLELANIVKRKQHGRISVYSFKKNGEEMLIQWFAQTAKENEEAEGIVENISSKN